MTTTNTEALSFRISYSARGADDGRGHKLDRVIFEVERCGEFELASYDGRAVEVYERTDDGCSLYCGTVADYAPGRGVIEATFAAAWCSTQRSARARRAFEASCKR